MYIFHDNIMYVPMNMFVATLVLAIAFFATIIVLFFVVDKLQTDKDSYKSGIWLAMGKVQRKKPVEDILKSMRCFLPKKDRQHFDRDFGDKNASS